jgi:tetratricopeptide (TPR) repeat protein
MIFNWLDASKAVELGVELADQLSPRTGTKPQSPQQALEEILARDSHGIRPSELNFYKRAKLANSFKWRLIENGLERAAADEITQTLVLNLAMSKGERPATDEAAAQNARPSGNIQQLLAQGNKYLEQGDCEKAAGIFERLLEIDPHHAVALNNMGAALSKLSQYREAEKYFRAAIKERPDFADAYSNLGMVSRWRGYFVDSEKSLRSALKLNPKHVGARVNLGTTLALMNRFRESKGYFNKILKTQPRNVEALFGMAQIAGMEGQFDESEKIFKRVLQVSPMMPAAWAALSNLRKMTSADDAWLRSVEQIAATDIPPMEAATLRFAMGKYHDDVGQFAQAFKSYRDANEILKPIAEDYDRTARTAFVDEQIRLYPREKMAAVPGGASASMKPVLVTGMMRSGTSLTEQIIASHPMAKGAGELEYWTTVMRDHDAAIRKQQFLADEPAVRSTAANYLRILDQVSGTALRVVDKAPINSDYLGVIHAVFPNVRIIYMQRDPIDVCLSSYFQNFSLAQSFTLDLSDMAHYYQQHHRLMSHWRSVLPPGTILDVPYEELLSNQEGWTRKILDFVGLEWDARCLEFYATERPIVTASFWQARQKIFKTSVQRWRNYEKYIAPLLPLQKLQS